MRDRIGVPAFGEHRNRNHAADRVAQPARFADGIHDFAQQVLVGDVLGLAWVAGALDDLAAEAIDFISSQRAEVVVQRFTGFELLAVDQQRARAPEWIAVFVVVAEQIQPTEFKLAGAVLVLPLETGDVVVDELRRGGVVAYDDEARRHGDLFFGPQLKGLLVVAVQSLECGLKLRRQVERIQRLGLAAALLGHLRADVLPQVAKHGHFATGDVVGNRHPRQFDDAALDCVHQREVAHRPWEQRSLGIARATQEEGRRGQVDHPRDAELAVDRLQPGDPQPGGFVVLLGLLPFVAFQVFIVVCGRLLAIAMVGFVVEYQDVLQAHQVGHYPLQHLAFGFERIEFFTTPLQ